jgi:hypothetical protein
LITNVMGPVTPGLPLLPRFLDAQEAGKGAAPGPGVSGAPTGSRSGALAGMSPGQCAALRD